MWSKHSGATDVFVRVGDSNIICNYEMYNRVLLLDGSRDVQSYLMTIIFCMGNFVLWWTLYNWYIQPSKRLIQSEHRTFVSEKMKLKMLCPKNRIWRLLHLKLQIPIWSTSVPLWIIIILALSLTSYISKLLCSEVSAYLWTLLE